MRRARSPEGGLQITRGARFVGSVWVVSQFPVVHLFTNILPILLSFIPQHERYLGKVRK